MATNSNTARRARYTWTDYLTWDDGDRWEIIGGDAYAMTPAPGLNHQSVVSELHRQMANWFAGRRCQVFVSPVVVRLSEEDVVQPDIVAVCDLSKLKPTHIEGAPTLVVEVLSPATEAHDRRRKMALYAGSGVREVWLVVPGADLLEVFSLDGATYRLTGTYTRGDKPVSPAFPKMLLDLRKAFKTSIPPAGRVRVVREAGPTWGVRKRKPAGRRGVSRR